MDYQDFYTEEEWVHFENGSLFDSTTVTGSSWTAQVIVYCIIFFIGVPGNIVLMIIFFKCQTEEPFKMSNSLIISLATADLDILIVYVPFYVAYEMLILIWPFGVVMCKVVFSSTHICLFASLGTLVAVAIERYLVPFEINVSKRKIILGLICVWFTAFVLSIPQMANFQLVSLDVEKPGDEYACELVWPDPMYEKVLHPLDFTLFYILPLIIITVLYVKITRVLRSAIKNSIPNRRFARQVQKVMYVLNVVVCAFGSGNLPIYVLHLFRIFWHDHWIALLDEYPWIFSICAALYLLPHCANPIIYSILDGKFRLEALKVFKMCKPTCRSIPCQSCSLSCRKRYTEGSSERSLWFLKVLSRETKSRVTGVRASTELKTVIYKSYAIA